MFRKLLDSILPAKLRNSSEDLRSERIFVAVLLITALSDLLAIGISNQIKAHGISTLLLTNAVVNLLILLLYNKGLPKGIAAHASIAQHAISFCFQAWSQGGLTSPAVAALFLLPAVTMLMVGKKGAIFWLFASILITTGFYVYETKFGAPAVQYDLTQKEYFFFGSILGTNITIFLILLVYENSKNKAIQIVQQKHADLVATQSQLIQSEKMASLGELTAGIAHEIQNPLNFVNNFSEVSSELIDEMNNELATGNWKPATDIANDLKQNLEKILHHGKRADTIVKGMLQHSRSSSGVKEPTDINALADEYLRLAYHGLRAKDKSFNATMKTDFDEKIGNIKVIPQDIGRVILNLITNAFYAVTERSSFANLSNEASAKLEATEDKKYEPTVSISTKKSGDKVFITVKDNGNGIPQKVLDKIFQPFFTTKPTGQGTGLGLSLSYDVVKAHGGELRVATKEGEGAEFTMILPI